MSFHFNAVAPGARHPALAPAPQGRLGPLDYRAIARRLYAERRARAQSFSQSGALFGEPAWDIMLELYVAGDAEQTVYVGNACIAADVAQTTGLRWVCKLERLGLLTRQSDPTDGRRGLVKMTARGRIEMEAYLCRVATFETPQSGARLR